MGTPIHLLNRLLVMLGALLLAVAASAALTAALGVLAVEQLPIGSWLREGLGLLTIPGRPERVIEQLVAAGVLLLAVTLLYIEIRSIRRSVRRPIVVADSPDGTITVSRTGLEQLARHVAMDTDGVMDATARVTGDVALAVQCRARVAHDAQAPALSEELQRRLRIGLARHVGRSVERVSVHTQFEPLARGVAARRRRSAALEWES